MTKQTRTTKSETAPSSQPRLWSFVLGYSFVIRHSWFVIFPSHLLRHLDSEKPETVFQDSSGQIAQGEARTSRRFLRFQHRASLVKCVEAVRYLEQVICQNI